MHYDTYEHISTNAYTVGLIATIASADVHVYLLKNNNLRKMHTQ